MNRLPGFDLDHPLLAMLHLKGHDPADRLQRAKREIDDLWSGGVDAVIVENYFGDLDDVLAACAYLVAERPDVAFGVNVLGDDWRSFEVAAEFGASFVQLDSVAGHLPPAEDAAFAARLAEARAIGPGLVLGGVRFKYQPHLSGRSLEEDLVLARQRCDAVVVTGEGTALETPRSKVEEFRRLVGDSFPLVVGAGVTPGNCREQLAAADAVIVGSFLKDTHTDDGDVDHAHVLELVRALRAVA